MMEIQRRSERLKLGGLCDTSMHVGHYHGYAQVTLTRFCPPMRKRVAIQVTPMLAFQHTLLQCGLVDLSFRSNRFTWRNGRYGAAFVEERLDKFVATLEWREMFVRPQCTTLPCLIPIMTQYCWTWIQQPILNAKVAESNVLRRSG